MASGNTIGMCGYPKYTKHTCAFTYMLAMCARVFTCVSLCVLVITAIAIAHRKLRFFLKKTKSSTRGFIRLAPQHDANVRRHVFMLQISSPTDARDYLNICTCVYVLPFSSRLHAPSTRIFIRCKNRCNSVCRLECACLSQSLPTNSRTHGRTRAGNNDCICHSSLRE